MKLKITIFLALFGACFLFLGCTQKGFEERLTSLDDPSVKFCKEQGAEPIFARKNSKNKAVLCKLKSGKIVDAWEFFNTHRLNER